MRSIPACRAEAGRHYTMIDDPTAGVIEMIAPAPAPGTTARIRAGGQERDIPGTTRLALHVAEGTPHAPALRLVEQGAPPKRDEAAIRASLRTLTDEALASAEADPDVADYVPQERLRRRAAKIAAGGSTRPPSIPALRSMSPGAQMRAIVDADDERLAQLADCSDEDIAATAADEIERRRGEVKAEAVEPVAEVAPVGAEPEDPAKPETTTPPHPVCAALEGATTAAEVVDAIRQHVGDSVGLEAAETACLADTRSKVVACLTAARKRIEGVEAAIAEGDHAELRRVASLTTVQDLWIAVRDRVAEALGEDGATAAIEAEPVPVDDEPGPPAAAVEAETGDEPTQRADEDEPAAPSTLEILRLLPAIPGAIWGASPRAEIVCLYGADEDEDEIAEIRRLDDGRWLTDARHAPAGAIRAVSGDLHDSLAEAAEALADAAEDSLAQEAVGGHERLDPDAWRDRHAPETVESIRAALADAPTAPDLYDHLRAAVADAERRGLTLSITITTGGRDAGATSTP